jgi:Tfp pilus assembly protein PilF
VDEMHDVDPIFRDLKPIRSTPPMFRVNGCGVALYGARDHDARTGTYVTTHCISLLFIPVFALGAYRVANAEGGGYYILGKGRLSGFARFWNLLVVFALLAVGGGVGWHYYTSSPGYLARQKLAEADRLAEGGELARAAALYREVATRDTGESQRGVEKLKALLDGADRAPMGEAAGVYAEAVNLDRTRSIKFANLPERAVERIDQDLDADPRGALALLDAVGERFEDPTKLEAHRLRVLKKLVAREPEDPEAASRLALIYEKQGQPGWCKDLLLPHVDHLGSTEGARILGQILSRQGEVEKAQSLLSPYIETHLQNLQEAQRAFDQALDALEQRIRSGDAAGFPYARFSEATQKEKLTLYNDYVKKQLEQNPGLRQAREGLIREGRVAGAALDLGIVFLNRARKQGDPADRKTDLEKAEKMFLAVRRQMGESADFQLNLGQVYYWLGRPAEGKKLFDQVLAKDARSPQALLGVAHVLRQVGAFSKARPLAEEAYNSAKEGAVKNSAATFRALTAVDLDDRIAWLEKVKDERDVSVQADLAAARGRKAFQDGKDAEAADHLRKAVGLYDKMPETSATLNNGALAWFSLYQATGEREALDRGIARMERAAELASDNSILLGNVGETLLETAVRDVIGEAIRVEALKERASLAYLSYLYGDEAGRAALAEQLRRHPGTAKAREYLERALVLAPKAPARYGSLASLFNAIRDEKALEDLRVRLAEADLDLADAEKQTREWYQGVRQEERLKQLRSARKRQRAIREEQAGGKRDMTYAVAAVNESGTVAALAWMGEKEDLDEALRLAESAHEASPSWATHSVLMNVLLTRGAVTLSGANPEFKKVCERCRRSLGPGNVVATVLERGGPLAEAVAGQPDIARALGLVREMAQKFPEGIDEWGWALLSRTDPEKAKEMAGRLTKSKRHALNREIDSALNPLGASAVMEKYWAARMAGRNAEADRVLADAAARKVPLPFTRSGG